MVFPEAGIGARIFPPSSSAALDDYYRERGVEVLPEASVTRDRAARRRRRVTLGDGRALEADAVVAGLGIEPNVELAAEGRSAGRERHRRRRVRAASAAGRTSSPPATSPASRFPRSTARCASSTRTTRRATAARSARTWPAPAEPYDHLPFFYSDLFDLGYEAVGELDSRLETVAELGELDEQGIVYYVDGERRPAGVLLWNQFGQVDAARELIRAGKPVAKGALGERVG